MSWPQPQLRRITHFAYGESLSDDVREEGEVPVYGSNGPVGVHRASNTSGPVLVVGRKGSFGKIQFSETPVFAIDTTYFVDGSQSSADLKWLYYAMGTLGLDALSEDVGVPGLSRERAYAQRLPLPPLAIQRSIADYLDAETARIDALIEKKRRMVELLEERSQSVIADSNPGAIIYGSDGRPMGIEGVSCPRLGSVSLIQTGLTLDQGRESGAKAVTAPYLRVANVQDGRLDLDVLKEVTVPIDLARRCSLRPGDVLMTEGGDADKLGRGTVWPGEITPCLHQNHIFAVRTSKDLLPEYLALMTRTPYARAYFEMTASKTTGIASTSTTKIASFRIPLPPIRDQILIVDATMEKLNLISQTRGRVENQIDLLAEHRQALVTAAVTGELPVPGVAA